tara:strand:- start:24 stop:452 length:429 start_codon:yes stop_codon:yes gene_type:complete
MTKKIKHILIDEADLDFDMIGICSHHNDYRLAWSINEHIGIQLKKAKSYIVTNKKGTLTTHHSRYEFEDEDNRLMYYMIKNKHQGQYLIPEKATIDFFLFLCENCAVDLDGLISKLKTTPCVLGAYSFYPDEIESAQNLVLE